MPMLLTIPRRPFSLAVLCLVLILAVAVPAQALKIQFDYTYDTSGFLLAQDRRATLEAAARVLENQITDSLTAIQPGGGNTWSAVFPSPGTGQMVEVANRTIPANTLLVYVGGRDLGGGEVGYGGPGGYNSFGTTTWNNTVAARGQPSATGQFPNDFGPWGGSITFDTHVAPSQPRSWHFGLDSPPPAGATDFYTTALHELVHVLGFGTSNSWNTFVDPSGGFNGPWTSAVYGGPVPLHNHEDRGHWKEGLWSKSTWTGLDQETALDPTQNYGTRKALTELDWYALDDIGWDLVNVPKAIPGDANGDRKVTFDDFSVLKHYFFQSVYGPAKGDFNASGLVDLRDFILLKNNFGRSATAVPEPASALLALFGLGLIGLWRVRRRLSLPSASAEAR